MSNVITLTTNNQTGRFDGYFTEDKDVLIEEATSGPRTFTTLEYLSEPASLEDLEKALEELS